jgi:GNAT superfamily N-acetyltransferase
MAMAEKASRIDSAPITVPQLGRESDLEHVKTWRRALEQATEKYFNFVYRNKIIHLIWLATHLDYQNRGAAKKLVRWGPEMADEHQMAVTLFGAPLSLSFYNNFGFNLLGTVTVQVDGEEEKVEMNAMVSEFRAE